MSDDQFAKLFKHMNKRFDDMDVRFDGVNTRIDSLEKTLDAYAKRADTYYQEMVALGSKVDRLEKALKEVIEATGVKVTI